VVHQHEGELGDLDAVAGDGDHGAGMCRGADGAAEAAAAAVRRGAGVQEVLMAAGAEWSERAGGTSGALWSAALMALASSLSGPGPYGAPDLVRAVTAGREAIVGLGQAEMGDKTIVDALSPFVEVLTLEIAQGNGVRAALRIAAEAATNAAATTAALRPRKGRARPLAERSVGSPDPGAVSFALIVTALAAQADVWAGDYRPDGAE
jgi:dihydroxyacetone kinase